MKILISADIEGVSGVVHPDQIYPDGKFYKETLEKWVLELSAIVEGLNASGVKDIVINDSHNHMRNIDNFRLKNCSVISGWQKPFSMVCGADMDLDACIFSGYHAMAGANGVLSHTYRPRIIKAVKLNNVLVGETGLNSALLGAFNIPVIMVTGDDVLCDEAKTLLGKNLITVETKKALSRYSALSVPLDENLKNLKESTIKAINEKEKIKPYKLSSPITLDVEFYEPNHADGAVLIPTVERVNNSSVRFISNNMSIVFQCFLAMGGLARLRDEVLT